MDFNLPEELQMLKETVRRFVDKELIPLEREYRPEAEEGMPEKLLKPLQEKTRALGLWMLDVPREYGGAGLDLLTRCVVSEELSRTVALPFRHIEIFGPEVRPVLFYYNEEQKERFLFLVLRGEMRVCLPKPSPMPAATRRRCGPGRFATAITSSSMGPSVSLPAPAAQTMPR